MWSSRPSASVAVTWRTAVRTAGIVIATTASRVTSRALERSPGASRPSGRTKFESVRPSVFACAFISPANAEKLGAVASASASAASLADWIRAAFTRSATVICWWGSRYADSWPTAAARGSTLTTWESFRCWRATMTVISFVIEAIGVW